MSNKSTSVQYGLNRIFEQDDLEIIAYYLALNIDEQEDVKVKKRMSNMLGKMQGIGIWGHLPKLSTNFKY
jgi:hypothetical protein